MNLGKIWEIDYRKALLGYVIICFCLSILELIILKSFYWSFWVSYFGLLFIGPFVRRALNEFFEQLHIKKVVRSLIIPWLIFWLITLYVYIFFFSHYTTSNQNLFQNPISNYILIIGIIGLILISIHPLIRIVAVAFHRKRTKLFPINRIEYAALKYLKQSEKETLDFYELKEMIRGTLNIFTPNIYFDDQTSISSIYHLCGLRLADIKANLVTLNDKGSQEGKLWEETLNNQIKKFNKILNSKGVLVRSFTILLFLSLLKIIIGFISSESLRAEGFENFLDCIAVILIGIGIRFQKEKFANVILITLMSIAAISIVWEAIESIMIGPKPISNTLIIIVIAIISIFFNTYLRTLKSFVGKKNRNSSLVASAIDSKINIMISIGIILGSLFSEFGTSIGNPIFYYLDPIIAIGISVFIFREVYEILTEFITGKEDEIEFERFQMKYEENFEEYIIKWILILFQDKSVENLNKEKLGISFQNSLIKGENIYSEFSHFGLFLFKEKGISNIINSLIDNNLLQENHGILNVTKKGKYLYDVFYSKPLLDDIKDPFDFFFEQNYEFNTLKKRKKEILEDYKKKV